MPLHTRRVAHKDPDLQHPGDLHRICLLYRLAQILVVIADNVNHAITLIIIIIIITIIFIIIAIIIIIIVIIIIIFVIQRIGKSF